MLSIHNECRRTQVKVQDNWEGLARHKGGSLKARVLREQQQQAISPPANGLLRSAVISSLAASPAAQRLSYILSALSYYTLRGP